MTSAPVIARRVRHCWPNQPNSGPVTMPPRRTGASLTKKPCVLASVYCASSTRAVGQQEVADERGERGAEPEQRRAPRLRWVAPARKASDSHGAERRLTSLDQPAAHGWWTSGCRGTGRRRRKAAESTSDDQRPISLGLRPLRSISSMR